MKVLITYKIPDPGIELLKKHFLVDVHEGPGFLTREELMSKITDADAVVTQLRDQVDREFIDAGKRLKIIANYAVGYNNIDVEYATRKNIYVTHTPGVLTEATADIAWALILAVVRRVVEADRFTRQGKFEGWKPELFLGYDIYGKILGILGMGRIGQAVARRALGFGMKIIYHNRKRLPEEIERKYNAQYVDLEVLFREADIVSIHTPLTPETYHLVDEKLLSLMKPSAFLINTSRGAVVNERKLYEFLKEGRIAGAGLDVYEHEPMLTPGLSELDNVVLLPHIGSATIETRTRMAIMVAENVIAALKGSIPPNIVPEQKEVFINGK
ncbi:MAG: D-glycerate dehydrogenase [Thermotogae bacterium]|nr:D-glycerate dehydrogenase [Thermotogota bacterium]